MASHIEVGDHVLVKSTYASSVTGTVTGRSEHEGVARLTVELLLRVVRGQELPVRRGETIEVSPGRWIRRGGDSLQVGDFVRYYWSIDLQTYLEGKIFQAGDSESFHIQVAREFDRGIEVQPSCQVATWHPEVDGGKDSGWPSPVRRVAIIGEPSQQEVRRRVKRSGVTRSHLSNT